MRSALAVFAALASLSPRPGLAEYKTNYADRPVALTISGGVSLGSYEAGVNWALVRVLREANAELVTVTGASAGNINTLLTAYSWCGVDPQFQTPEQSLFWKSWIPVGLDKLMPRNQFESGYADKNEGLFTRTAFQESLAHLAAISSLQAQQDCALRLGITLSKRDPGTLVIPAGKKDLDIPAMRYVVPFKAAAAKGQQLKFSAPTVDEIEAWNIKNLGLHLIPGEPGVEFPLDPQLRDYVLAASAFPYAFGSLWLSYWAPSKNGGGYASDTGVFLDGGVFDNIPVGLSLQLLTEGATTAPAPGTRQGLIFDIDPDQRRQSFPPASTPGNVPLAGIASVTAFLDGAVSSARKYELQTLERYGLRNAELRLTDRTTNVFGEYYFAFGAFTEQRFREMDFYLGLFDGLMSAAEWSCETVTAPLEQCVVGEVLAMKQQLQLASRSPISAYVVDRLLTWLYPAESGRRKVTPDPSGIGPQGDLTAPEVEVMLDVLTTREYGSFAELLDALRTTGSDKGVEWDAPVIAHPHGFFAEYSNRALTRALTIERANGTAGVIRPLAFANLVARSMAPQLEFEWDPSTIPDGRDGFATPAATVGHLLPYYLGFEFFPSGEFGFRAQWRPTVPLSSRWRLTFPVEAAWLGVSHGSRVGAGLGAKLMLASSVGMSADVAVGGGLWGRELVDRVRADSTTLWVDPSLQAGLTLFESFRVGYTYHPGPQLHGISLGLNDFNGIAYWLGRTVVGK
ncbi:patatin-like phospholipase family protein [Archangium primigenium]|uniref:patatin-like phospholipase family protein n=1 Tax=[Archangium] primigenium TaxID=2792470 RepID=UPI001956FC47|nr:patatin-like phospholipase family protein [Archangium primigenium]